MKTSVVIPAYKAAATVERAIRSVLENLREIDLEVILIEDGIIDNTKDVVARISGPIRHIRLSRNMGAQVARNVGLSLVTTDTVLFLDADDYVLPGLLSGLHAALQCYDTAVAFGPYASQIGDSAPGRVRYPRKGESRHEIARRWLKGRSGPPTCSVMWRTEDLRRIGGWNEKMVRNQDGELVLRALSRGCEVAVSENGCGIYYHHGGVRISRRNDWESYECQKIIVEMMDEWDSTEPEAELKQAIGEFCRRIAMRAYRHGLVEIGDFWSNLSNEYCPRISIDMDDSLTQVVKKILCKVVGVRSASILIHRLKGMNHPGF